MIKITLITALLALTACASRAPADDNEPSFGKKLFGVIGAMGKGFSNGYSANRNKTVNCTSYNNGGQIQTTCY